MRYPPQFLDRLRGHFRLSEVIGRRVPLKKHGREYMANCPFHNEKTPSFTVSDEKGFYHCFGCQAHGDVIGFIKEYEGLNYIQAVESLAREAGIPLPELTPRQKQVYDLSEKLYEVLEEATRWFSDQLKRPSNSHAADYFAKRGISEESIRQFRLGYAPRDRQGLHQHLVKKGFPEQLLREAGILSVAEDGSAYDKFRGRVIFPIRDIGGRVIAFGGRILDSAAAPNAPKYLNSQETVLFSKGHVLYNLDIARKAAARGGQVMLCEGYMDVIALAQAGLAHAVAPLGTAVTENHLLMAWQLSDEPVMCLDGDAAGLKAMARTLDLALPHLKPGKSLHFCLLPQGEDPDSIVKSGGAPAMQELIKQAIPLVEMLWRTRFNPADMAMPEKRAAARANLMQAVGHIKDKEVQHAYREEMNRRLWEAGRLTGSKTKASSRQTVASPANNLSSRLPLTVSTEKQQERVQQQILSLLLAVPELFKEPIIESLLETMHFEDRKGEEIRMVIINHIMEGGEGIPEFSLELQPEVDSMTALGNQQLAFTLRPQLDAIERLELGRQALTLAVESLQSLVVRREVATSLSAPGAMDEERMQRALALLQESRRLLQQEYFLKTEDNPS